MDTSPLLYKSTSYEAFPLAEKLEKDYGFNLETNIKLTESDPEVCPVWKWLNFFKSNNTSPEGLLQIVEKTESLIKVQSFYPVYHSEERVKALKILDLEFFTSKSMENQSVRSRISKTKLAMYSIFSFDNYLALRELEESNILFPVLQNYQESDANYTKMCKTLSKTQADPWVKSSLLFLSGPQNTKKILELFNILDSAAFSLRFLNDSDLKQHLKSLQTKGEETGDLHTIILSGFTSETPLLLQKYYERTGDIQTVGILSIFAQQASRSEILDNFVQHYKAQLNRAELFYVKCQFEIEEFKLLGKKKERGKVIRCYYCGNSNARCDVLANASIARKVESRSHDQAIFNHCLSCPGSLPRCCVCLCSMKTLNPYFLNKTGKEISLGLFIWCEKCHHGGHNAHVLEWFNENSACPVFGCGCHCASMDS